MARLLLETKTTGDSIAPDSDYWPQARISSQPSSYMNAAQSTGHVLDGILWDAIHKPGMKPKQMPELDCNSDKIVLRENGSRAYKKNGEPRQSGSKADGLTLQTRLETPAEFGERLRADIYARPDFYYRREIFARLDSDLEEFRFDLWQTQKMMRFAQLNDYWPKRTESCLHPYRCAYGKLCFNGITPKSLDGQVPEGFVQVTTLHPELEETDDAPTGCTSGAEDCSAAAATV